MEDREPLVSPPAPWPDLRLLARQIPDYRHLDDVARSARAIAGLVCDIDRDGVGWLEAFLTAGVDRKCRIIVALYPACATRSDALSDLLSLKESLEGRADIRLWLASSAEMPSNTLYLAADEGARGVLVHGASCNLGGNQVEPHVSDVIVRPEAGLLASWDNWFTWMWANAVPLCPSTVQIPALVPATGTPEAASMWETYLAQCSSTKDLLALSESLAGEQDGDTEAPVAVAVDPDTGNVTVTTTDGDPVDSPLAELGITPDGVIGAISQLYDKGAMVTIDKATRVPPLDVPVKAEWFDVPGFRQMGVASREIKYRISAFDDRSLKPIENKRKAAREVLAHFSFSLGDSVYWMPDAAQSLFEQEMTRINQEGKGLLGKEVGDELDAFLESRRTAIAADANEMYQEFSPGKQLSERVIENILGELKRRIGVALGGQLLPKVSYAHVQCDLRPGTEWSSSWGQALTFLRAVAEFPRKAITNSYFLRGVKVDLDDILNAMDICRDALVAAWNETGGSRRLEKRAAYELDLIAELLASAQDDRAKCQALLALVDGDEPPGPGG